MISARQAQDYLQQSDVLYRSDEVQAALARLAREISSRLGESQPLVLAVMGGAVVFVGQLLPLLDFPLDFDYVHVSRYGHRQQGGELHWKVQPQHETLKGRVVLVLDDILDEGETLAAVKRRVLELGAAEFHCAVFADKRHGRPKPLHADFVGIEVPDRFVFGYGMDIHGAWRNLPAIHALKEN